MSRTKKDSIYITLLLFQIVALACVAYVSGQFHHAQPKTVDHHHHHEASILKQFQDVNVDGNYKYAYETDSGIAANEEGHGGVQATGGASWTSPEGIPVHFSYTADENGYQPTGSHVPETPAHIARALEYIRTHPGYVEPTPYGKSHGVKNVHV